MCNTEAALLENLPENQVPLITSPERGATSVIAPTSEVARRSQPDESPSPVSVRLLHEHGEYRGDFTLTFTGAVRQPGQAEQRKRAPEFDPERLLMGMLVQCLGPGDELDFIYTSGGRMQLGWQILGRSAAHQDEGSARAAAESLWRTTEVLLKSSGTACRFQTGRGGPAQFATQDIATLSGWSARIHPSSVRVDLAPAKGAVGFRSTAQPPLPAPAELRLPLPAGRPATPVCVPQIVAASAVPFTLRVTLRRQMLDCNRRDALMQAATALRLQANLAESVSPQPTGRRLPFHPETLVKQVDAWLKETCLTEVECRAHSRNPVPVPLLRLLGEGVFGGPVDVNQRPQTEERVDVKPVESSRFLTACRPADAPLPLLIPNEGVLESTGAPRSFLLDSIDLPESGVALGVLQDGTLRHFVRLPAACRSRHAYILGATGTGKSTLLFNMIAADLEAGEGVGLMDPHGDLYEQVLAAIPANRAKDVVLFDPADTERAAGLNFLECKGPFRSRQAQFIINELLRCFQRLWDMKQCGGPMFELYFRNALLLLMNDPKGTPTLLDVSRVFDDKEWRTGLLASCTDPLVVQFWQMALRTTGDQALANFAPYVSCKLNRFTHNAVLRPIVGQLKTTFCLREIMDHRKIFLANLSKGELGEEDSQFIGLLLFGKICQAALSRTSLPVAKRTAFHLYVDEFQNLTSDTVGTLLAEARKYGLALTLANQNLGQLRGRGGHSPLLDAVLCNVGTMVAFRTGAPDAGELEKYFMPELSGHELQYLPNFSAAVRLMTTRGPTPAMVMHTLPPVVLTGPIAKPGSIRRRHVRHTWPLAQVELEIDERLKSREVAGQVRPDCP